GAVCGAVPGSAGSVPDDREAPWVWPAEHHRPGRPGAAWYVFLFEHPAHLCDGAVVAAAGVRDGTVCPGPEAGRPSGTPAPGSSGNEPPRGSVDPPLPVPASVPGAGDPKPALHLPETAVLPEAVPVGGACHGSDGVSEPVWL